MGSEKKIKSRIVHKHDSEENWQKAINFIPKQGEIIIYDKDDAHDYGRIKLGDGQTTVSALPFMVIQPDFKQIDPSKPDYIRNKPGMFSAVIKNHSLIIRDDGSYTSSIDNNTLTLTREDDTSNVQYTSFIENDILKLDYGNNQVNTDTGIKFETLSIVEIEISDELLTTA